jgi:hypothetical protein
MTGGVNLIKIFCKQICKCYNVSSMYNYMLIKSKKKKRIKKNGKLGTRGSHLYS